MRSEDVNVWSFLGVDCPAFYWRPETRTMNKKPKLNQIQLLVPGAPSTETVNVSATAVLTDT